eukprot:Anaeramoba_ignava/a222918_17.p1 GENE.a222918_17~~a222918_17.p1  ORF type:complete len:188 (-),score=69.37 a222918_17:213-776(-)
MSTQSTDNKKPEEPKRPLNAYILFAEDVRERITKENPNISLGKLGKLTGEEWRALDSESKKIYFERSREEQRKYNQKMQEYKEAQKENSQETTTSSEERIIMTRAARSRRRKKRAKKRKKKPEEKKPDLKKKLKKPMTGYLLWVKEVTPQIKSEFPKIRAWELSSKIGKKWKELPDFRKSKRIEKEI